MDVAPEQLAPRPSNGLGTAGFIVSLVGLILTCGLLCPIGLLLSFFALFREPRGLAIAGTVIGGLGSALLAFVGLGIFVAGSSLESMENFTFGGGALRSAQDVVDAAVLERGEVPGDSEGAALVAGEPDRWGTPPRYTRTPAGYELRSAGPDLVFETLDDVFAVVER